MSTENPIADCIVTAAEARMLPDGTIISEWVGGQPQHALVRYPEGWRTTIPDGMFGAMPAEPGGRAVDEYLVWHVGPEPDPETAEEAAAAHERLVGYRDRVHAHERYSPDNPPPAAPTYSCPCGTGEEPCPLPDGRTACGLDEVEPNRALWTCHLCSGIGTRENIVEVHAASMRSGHWCPGDPNPVPPKTAPPPTPPAAAGPVFPWDPAPLIEAVETLIGVVLANCGDSDGCIVNSGEEALEEFCRDAAVRAETVRDLIPEPFTLPVSAEPADLAGHVTTAEVERWHRERFGRVAESRLAALKIAEETGEIAGAVVKRAEGAVRPDKGLTTYAEWTRHLHTEIGDAGITLHSLCASEGVDLDTLIARRFRDDVALRTGQEAPVVGDGRPPAYVPGPRPLVVGDEVTTREALGRLPIGARVAIYSTGVVATRTTPEFWDVPLPRLYRVIEVPFDTLHLTHLPKTGDTDR